MRMYKKDDAALKVNKRAIENDIRLEIKEKVVWKGKKG